MASQITQQIERLTRLYCDRVLPERSRTIDLAGRKCRPEILYTFLGFELKMGRKRLTCPDLNTARYLRVFAELGSASIEVPYDLTRTTALLPQLEESFARLKELVEQKSPDAQRAVYARIRAKLKKCLEMKREARSTKHEAQSTKL